MSKYLSICFLSLFTFYYAASEANTASSAHIQVCFTPEQNCTMKITDVLDSAKKSISVQAYSFTSIPIAKHLVKAKKRGVTVKIILDKSQILKKYSALRILLKQHIPIWIDYKPEIAHNKIMIIDEKKVITGSFNFTMAAQNKNVENVLIICDTDLAKRYMENWQRRQAVSEALG